MTPQIGTKIKQTSELAKISLIMNTCPCKKCLEVKDLGIDEMNDKTLSTFNEHTKVIEVSRTLLATKGNDCECSGCSEIKSIGIEESMKILKNQFIKAFKFFNQHSALSDGTPVCEGDTVEWTDSDGNLRTDNVKRNLDGSLFMVNINFHLHDYKSATLKNT